MQIPRRKFLHFTLGAASMPLALRRAMAGAYPDHPVRVIVGYAAGGPTEAPRAAQRTRKSAIITAKKPKRRA